MKYKGKCSPVHEGRLNMYVLIVLYCIMYCLIFAYIVFLFIVSNWFSSFLFLLVCIHLLCIVFNYWFVFNGLYCFLLFFIVL